MDAEREDAPKEEDCSKGEAMGSVRMQERDGSWCRRTMKNGNKLGGGGRRPSSRRGSSTVVALHCARLCERLSAAASRSACCSLAPPAGGERPRRGPQGGPPGRAPRAGGTAPSRLAAVSNLVI